MVTTIRVVHIPGRTQYARKLRDDGIEVLNETMVDGLVVPRDATLGWLLENRPWDWVDVIHLHHPDFEPITRLRAVLAECRRAGKQVVFTAHDVNPVFGDRGAHHRKLRALADRGVPFVSLTPAADMDVRQRLGARTIMVPHGHVATPGASARTMPRAAGPTRFLIYGSLRRNRDVELVLACWRYAQHLRDTTLHLLLRAPSRASLTEDAVIWKAIRDHAGDPRLRIDVLPFPTDNDLDKAVADADCLLLPYRWASHSGQLEHALDLGVLPVAARTGFLPDQVALHSGRAPEPVWFDWSDGASFDYGARLLEAMVRAHMAISNGWQSRGTKEFTNYRRREHAELLTAYRALYEGQL